MVFKIDWEKSQTQHKLPDNLPQKMIELAFPNEKVILLDLIAGGCANINYKVEFKANKKPVILRIHLRDKKSGYLEKNIANLLKEELPVPQIQYIGNFFGWKISIIGAIVLLLFGLLIAYGHYAGKIDIRTGQPINKTNYSIPIDSVK